MTHPKLAAGVAGLAVVAIGGTLAIGASGATPDTAVIKQKTSIKMKANRYIQDGLRFNKDVYTVKSGGTLKVVLTVADEGPHTITVVKKADLPTTGQEVAQCKVCEKLGKVHGFPRGEGPPKFFYLENGKGQKKPPNYDRPGDSGIPGTKKGDSFKTKVTAKPGTTLNFMCLIHPWMQAKIAVK
jgi:plastocyanin